LDATRNLLEKEANERHPSCQTKSSLHFLWFWKNSVFSYLQHLPSESACYRILKKSETFTLSRSVNCQMKDAQWADEYIRSDIAENKINW
jgi:hypothetical protein